MAIKTKLMVSLGILIGITALFTGCINVETGVEYEVTFNATWSEDTHPDDFPPNPHFSGLIGASHNDQVIFWEEGGTATTGIKNMAETGSKDQLTIEVGKAILDKNALTLISGSGINPSPGSASVNFVVTEEYPLVTLVTMIAPSPDWFIGVNGMNLYEEGEFVEEKTIVLYAYDAGTDSGTNYTSADKPTDPQELIFKIEGYPFIYDEELIPLGTFEFKKIK